MSPTTTGTVLDGIIAGVLKDLHERQLMVTSDNLREAIELVAPAIDPIPRLTSPGLSVISEVKRSSPSKGQLATISDPAALADQYRAGGAAAISVLTEERRFQGSLADLDAVRAKVEIPVLRKDFVVTDYQVLEARAHGADLVLLIVAALSDDDLRRLYDLACELGMTPLVEVHTAEEARRAAALDARVVGVNARNLKTLDVDRSIFGRLLGELPEGVVKVAESGILRVDQAVEAHDCGADAVLVGEMLVRHGEPAQVLREIHRATV
ncbi:indole-3-glycerol phosphate synthase TrpC [Cutibacterium sp. WCA-380-WT-3A]|uniref:Indole-3-glycerol phosphate synthase n=1 Tax=Cutibacterium porci TaxID=2605781 RepID=A0A7K0J6R9_9ACTN|nr:indole-3-glycerol phosphate synthase TrpC [Cutibacterium porci]MSS45523.1 indole-3-glycerol phosphate synthase TrpC [Cutibacterium porci]